ncbi:hypothetical protein LTR62_003528 [Meristemomyces frigidus]|uniref:Bud22 domain-containing protein n=1 Tax=Meristemomyces frigidus TaxID=1508187 RepID=A0AAN7YGR7_9PEZI|nr:hypothetical protein LTR62_003528 [Meristemomyces frigidus]
MPKRKQENEEVLTAKRARKTENAVAPSGAVRSAKQQRVRHYLKHGTVKLGHAFKIAKGFERQKLGRRHKTAVTGGNNKDVQRINAEVAAIKTLDTGKCGHIYLCKVLLKIKAVDGSQDLPEEVRKPVKLSEDVAVLNVFARLCNSNPVKEVLPEVLEGVHKALGLKYSGEGVSKKKRVRAKDYDDGGKEVMKRVGVVTQPGSSDPGADEDGERGRAQQRPTEVDGNDLSDEEIAQYSDRLAASESEDNSDEEQDVAAIERQLEAEGLKRRDTKLSKSKYDLSADLSLSEDDSASDSDSSGMALNPRKASTTRRQIAMPSLLGGYISGDSGSDIEDIDEAPKKNRRGQRARQAIWEQKFGAKANHMQKANRNTGWDPKRGAVEGVNSMRLGGRIEGRRTERAAGDRSDGKTNAVVAKPQEAAKPMHPSWEAAKKAKDKAQVITKFEGKKITFE